MTDRRNFLKAAAGTFVAGGLARQVAAREGHPAANVAPGRAKHCIMIWLGGGACQIDTWDPKRIGDPEERTPGSAYPSIPTAVRDVRVCEHLPRSADRLDRAVLLRTVHHDVIDEHAAATDRMHTGRPTTGTIAYPSLGSVAAHQLEPLGDAVPPYVLVGYASPSKGPGFLGPSAAPVALTDTNSRPAGLAPPPGLSVARRERRERMLERLRSDYLTRSGGDARVAEYDETLAQALRFGGESFMGTFDLDREPAKIRDSFGGEFGQRLLLARRLIERGTRFVEVSHNLNFINGSGWDTHNQGQQNQHLLIRELDIAFAALLDDLERTKLLDDTLVVISTEFGRPAGFDGGGGRGHHSKAFSVVLAGGGLKTGRVVGETGELGMKPLGQRVSVPDLHATIYHALSIDPAEELYAGERPVPITDGGRPLAELF